MSSQNNAPSTSMSDAELARDAKANQVVALLREWQRPLDKLDPLDWLALMDPEQEDPMGVHGVTMAPLETFQGWGGKEMDNEVAQVVWAIRQIEEGCDDPMFLVSSTGSWVRGDFYDSTDPDAFGFTRNGFGISVEFAPCHLFDRDDAPHGPEAIAKWIVTGLLRRRDEMVAEFDAAFTPVVPSLV